MLLAVCLAGMTLAACGGASSIDSATGHTRTYRTTYEDLGAVLSSLFESPTTEMAPPASWNHDAIILTMRIRALGDPAASVSAGPQGLVVQSPKPLPVTAAALATPGDISFRPVICFGPTAAATAVSTASSAMSCAPGPAPDPTLAAVASTAPANDFPDDDVVLPVPSGSTLPGARFLLGPSVLPDSGSVLSASVVEVSSQWVVLVRLTAHGAALWALATRVAFHHYIAVDLDGTVISTSNIEPTQTSYGPPGNSVQLSDNYTESRARYLAAILNAGPLVSNLTPKGESSDSTAAGPTVVGTGVAPEAVSFWNTQRGLLVSTLTTPACEMGSALCRGGLIERTVDGGRSWQVVDQVSVPLDAVRVTGSDVAWVSSGRCDSASANGCGSSLLLVTSDGGTSWSPVTPSQAVTSVTPVSRDTAWAVAGAANAAFPIGTSLVKSTDGGRTWRSEPGPCQDGAEGGLWTVEFTGPDSGWALCASEPATDLQPKGLYVTDDAAVRWHLQSACPLGPGPGHIVVGALSCIGYLPGMDFLAGGDGWIWTMRGGLATTRDSGITWDAIALNIVFDDANSVLSASRVTGTDGFLLLSGPESPAGCSAAGCGPELLVTADGGSTWTTVMSWAPA